MRGRRMSLILDALKRLRGENAERSAGIPPVFTAGRRRRFKPLKLLYLSLSVPAFIFGAYIAVNNLKQLSGKLGAGRLAPISTSRSVRPPKVERASSEGGVDMAAIPDLIPLQEILPPRPLQCGTIEPIIGDQPVPPPRMEVSPKSAGIDRLPEPREDLRIAPKPEPIRPAQKREEKSSPPPEAAKPKEASARLSEADYRFNLGAFYQERGDLRRALREYREALRLDPSNARAHNNIGVIYREMGLLDEAIKEYRRALEIDPGYAKALNNLGVALYIKGDLEGAAEALKKSIKIDPGNAASYVNLGLVLKKQGLIDQAADMFRRAISIDRGCAEAYYNLALLLEEEGKIKAAIRCYERFLELAEEEHPDLRARVEEHLSELRGKRGGER